MKQVEKEWIVAFAKNIALEISNHYGYAIMVDVNNNQQGSIAWDSITFAGKSIERCFEKGFRARATIHDMVSQLNDREPNGFEGIYWLALNLIASYIGFRNGARGRSRIKVKAVGSEIRALSVRFTFDEMARLFLTDDMKRIPVPAVNGSGTVNNGAQKWNDKTTKDFQVYVAAMVDHLSREWGFKYKKSSLIELIFRKNRLSYVNKNRKSGFDYLMVFGFESMGRNFTKGRNEYKVVRKLWPFIENSVGTMGPEALYWLTCHEFAHVLQTEYETRTGEIERTRSGNQKIHNRRFVAEFARVINSFSFENSLELIDPDLKRELLIAQRNEMLNK